jgi:hypothetical protein
MYRTYIVVSDKGNNLPQVVTVEINFDLVKVL